MKTEGRDGARAAPYIFYFVGVGGPIRGHLMGVFGRGIRTATHPAAGLCRIFALHSTALTLTKKGSEESEFRNQKRGWNGEVDERRKGLLARPIQTAFGRLPTSDLTLSTEIARQANCFPPLLGLLGLIVVRTAGNPLGNRFPFPRRRDLDFDWGVSVLDAS